MYCGHIYTVRDWSLIMGRGATKQQGGGGACEVLPLRKGGGVKGFSHAEGGTQKVLGLFLHGSLKF